MSEEMKKRFRLGDNWHEIGNDNCPKCNVTIYPILCKCGGLIHIDFEDLYNITECDLCGNEEGD